MLPRDDAPVDPAQFLESESEDATNGLLRWTSPSTELNLTLELFLREITGRLFRDVRAAYLFGSGALGDLAPAHGDIDLLIVMHREPGRAAAGEVRVVHRYLSSAAFAPWGRMIDAAYYPLAMLGDPGKAGHGLHARHGEVKTTTRLHLGAQERFFLHDHAVLLYGDEVRKDVLAPRPAELFDQARTIVERAKKLAPGVDPGDVIAACTGMVRTLYLLVHEKSASKSVAAKWFADTYRGKAGDVALEANKLRRGELPPGLGGIRKNVPDLFALVGSEVERLQKKEGRRR